MRTYCTIFDKNYLYQGVALYNSLKRCARDFKLYTLCMDATSYSMMIEMKSASLVPISVEDLITPEALAVRNRTTHGQFCWVCQPLVCEFVLNNFGHDMVTYLEADSLFFSDPEILLQELGEGSVSLVPHNYSPAFDHTFTSGRFCVQFNAFRNNREARAVLEYWKSNCYKYTREKPRFLPGQTCLDDWPERFDGVRVIQHLGAGVAPWNIQRFSCEVRNSVPYVDGVPIVFYHYHQYGRYENGSHELGSYPLPSHVINSIYKTYVNALDAAEKTVRTIDPTFAYRKWYKNNKTFSELIKSATLGNINEDVKGYLRVWRRKIRGTYNIFPDEFFRGSSKQDEECENVSRH